MSDGTTASATALKQAACAAIDAIAADLVAVSHGIHAEPELCFEEVRAARRLCAAAEARGLAVARPAYGLETAFEAEFGPAGAPCVALLAEYDALPEIGHACGHNLIATSALGATLALAALGDRLPGRVRFLGTPAEEGGGGKELMARAGAFEGVDAALMIHPAGINLATTPTLAIGRVEAVYHGRTAHASAQPWEGINALDGVITAYNAIAALRQHIRPTERIHGIITDGGVKPNIVPERAAAEFYVRAADAAALAALKLRVEGCLRAGAEATGARLDLQWVGVDYLDLHTSWPLAEAFQKNAESLGRTFMPLEDLPPGWAGSTDMGNVSHRVPSIHPLLAAAPPDVVIHNPAFAHWAGSAMGDACALDGAKALAMTALDFMTDAALRARTAEVFARTQPAAAAS
jgi:amidohydrolase